MNNDPMAPTTRPNYPNDIPPEQIEDLIASTTSLQNQVLRKFARACGVSDERILKAEQNGEVLPTTRAMRAWIWELSGIRTLPESCAGIMVALEGQLPTLYPKYVEAMRKMGFSEDDMEFFHVHIEGDTEHAHVGLELTARYATTPELQQRYPDGVPQEQLDTIVAELTGPRAGLQRPLQVLRAAAGGE